MNFCARWVGAMTLAVPLCALADDNDAGWRSVRHDSALDVYTRSVAGSDFDEVRVVGTICASLGALTAYVQDVSHIVDWIPDTEDARLLTQPSERERIYYLRTNMPWPVKDRDMIYRLVATPDPSATATTIEMTGLPDYLPAAADAVRMTSMHGLWRIEQQGAKRTHVVLQMRVEPGGSVPIWLGRRRIVALPTGMIENLERRFASACALH